MSVGTGQPTLPSADDRLVAGAVTAIGGPPGRRARLGERRLSPLRWVVVLVLATSALGFWQKAPCRVHEWNAEYQYTRACYTDVIALYYSEHLDRGDRPYLDSPVEYPVLIGAAMALVSSVSDDLADARPAGHVDPARAGARSFFDLTWVLLTGCAVVVALTTARLAGRRRYWDAAMVAVAPGLLLHAMTNWDLLAVAFAGLGLLAWARRQPVLAGVLLGLGVTTKLYPVLFLLPLLALCWRTGRLRAGLATAAALVATAALVTVPVYLVSPAFAEVGGAQVPVAASPLDRLAGSGLAALAPHTDAVVDGSHVTGVNAVWRFVQLNTERPADWDSLYYLLQRSRGQVAGPVGQAYDGFADLVLGPPGAGFGRLDATVAVSTVLAVGLVLVLALSAPRRPRLPQLLFLVLVAFLLTNKVFSPQYVLWLIPLAVLARPRWGPFLAWQATEAFLLFTRFYFFVSLPLGAGDQPSEGLRVQWFLSAVVLRDVALLLLAAAIVRDVLRPEGDRVRRDGVDDPAGGVLDGAPDRAAPAPA